MPCVELPTIYSKDIKGNQENESKQTNILKETPHWFGAAPLGGRTREREGGKEEEIKLMEGGREGRKEAKENKIKFSVPLVLID